jgi:hypothetical protein
MTAASIVAAQLEPLRISITPTASGRKWRASHDAMSKLYSALLLIALLFAMAGLGMAISMAITEVHHLIASTDNPRGMKR